MIELPLYLRLASITYSDMQDQADTGFLFDREAAVSLVQELETKMKEIEDEVHPQLPSRPLNKGEIKDATPPKLQFKQNGEPSAFVEKWFDMVEVHPFETGVVYKGHKNGVVVTLPHHEPIITEARMTLSNQEALKKWLMDSGWNPTIWNHKKVKDKYGKMKDVRDEKGRKIKTSPKFHEKGEFCPGLEVVAEKAPFIRDIVQWLVLGHRCGMVKGFLRNPRLNIDGRIPAEASGLTNTGRQKHKVIANLPRVSTPYGKEIRSLFIAPEDKVLVGYDASSLEARVKGHYTAKYDGGAYASKVLSDDYDEHEENAKLWERDRQAAKTPGYALQYFSGVATFSKALGVPEAQGQVYYDRYWEENWALKKVDEEVARYWEAHGKKYIITIDRSKKYTRSRHSITNTLFQSTGAKIMDMSWTFMRKWLKERGIEYKRVVYYHDEYIVECNPEDAELVGELAVKSIVQAGKFFKLRVPLDAEYKIGHSWADVH